MATGPVSAQRSDGDALLSDAWDEFCDRLKAARGIVFRYPDQDPTDRAAGIQYLSRYIQKGLNDAFEYRDPEYPEFYWYQTPTSKSFGDNPDCTYLVAYVDGRHEYRITGNRGTVSWVSFIVRRAADRPGSTHASVLNNRNLQTETDGSFSISLSLSDRPGNHLKIDPGVSRIFVRQFFGDWETEQPMRIRIERVDDHAPPPPPTPERVAAGLRAAMDFFIEDATRWVDWVDWFARNPHNEFFSGLPEGGGNVTALGRNLCHCYWEVRPDEALLMSVRPPESAYWNFELGNRWWCSVDYRYRLSSVNCKQASVEADGMVHVVAAHRDPGVPNWLDCGGHTSGIVNVRWVESDDTPLPDCRLLKLADLPSALPLAAARIDPVRRREQLRRRKVGVDRRFAV